MKIFGVIAIGLALVGCSNPEADYDKALSEKSIATLEEVLARYPDHLQAQNARVLLEELRWIATSEMNSEIAYLAFLTDFPGSDKGAQAKAQIEGILLARAVGTNDIAVIEAFLEENDDLENPASAHEAIRSLTFEHGDVGQVERLLASGQEINGLRYDDAALLHFAAGDCRTDVVDTLIAAGADINLKAADMTRPLHRAVVSGCIAAVQKLVESGADIELKVAQGYQTYSVGSPNTEGEVGVAATNAPALALPGSPLAWAAAYGEHEIIRYLMDSGAEINAGIGSYDVAIAMRYAVQSGNLNTVKLLFDRGGGYVHGGRDARGISSSYKATIHYAKTAEIIDFLIERGADPAVESTGLGFSTHAAAGLGHNGSLRHFLSLDLDPNARGDWNGLTTNGPNVTPLWAAAASGNLEAVKILEDAGGDLMVEIEGNLAFKIGSGTLMHAAAAGGDTETIFYLAAKGLLIDKKSEFPHVAMFFEGWTGMTPVCVAAHYAQPNAIDALAKLGADLDGPCNGDWDALQIAAISRDEVTVRRLLEHGAKTLRTDSVGAWNTTDKINTLLEETFSTVDEVAAPDIATPASSK